MNGGCEKNRSGTFHHLHNTALEVYDGYFVKLIQKKACLKSGRQI